MQDVAVAGLPWLASARYPEARILMIDDSSEQLQLLDEVLKLAGYRQRYVASSSGHGLWLAERLHPDVILLDLHMPGLDGVTVIHHLRTLPSYSAYLPVLMLTGDTSIVAKERALQAGARDFLAKPYSPSELVFRLHNVLDTRFLCQQLERDKRMLQTEVSERTRELGRLDQELHAEQEAALERLALMTELRDDQTHQHTQRVSRTVQMLTTALGLPERGVIEMQRAATLHDIGKVNIPDAILLKPGPLSIEEFALMKTHTTTGAAILSARPTPMLKLAAEMALAHHERWDGTGYPFGLAGQEIPFSARVLAVADVYDALVNERPYKPAWAPERAAAEIYSLSGRHFDPSVVGAFTDIFRELLR